LFRQRWLWRRFVKGTMNVVKHRGVIAMSWNPNAQAGY
jgi:hypothetical protein